MAKEDRLRVSIDQSYLSSLGLALYCFASLEWMAVYVVQRIGEMGHNPATDATYVDKVSQKTAGRIANDLVEAAAGIADPTLRAIVEPIANRFKALTKRRNDLLHANPSTAPNGDQRLFRKGVEWSIPQVDDLADDFVGCNCELNNLYYKVL